MKDFAIVDDHGEFRPTGEFTLAAAVQLVTSAIAYAREQRVKKLLVVTTGCTGFNSPSLGERYFMAREWAAESGGAVRVVLVARPEMLDPEKFGKLVAANHGLMADMFVREDEALAWLADHAAD